MRPIACIVGSTASGKSDLAQAVALALDGEVVSADSMQVYKRMDIGTGKVLPEQRLVPHHGIDLVEPNEPYSAALFQRYARRTFMLLADAGKRAVLAGGTGFYVRAALDGYEFPAGEQADNPQREAYQAFLETHGPHALWERLRQLDPRSADAIHPHNAKRVIRALEMAHEGVSYADQVSRLKSIPQVVPARIVGLAVDPAVLNERIERRVDRMREAGLVGEVEDLLHHGFRDSLTAPAAIGYKEIVSALEGTISLDEAFDDVKRATRRYAKRQRTWFRRDERIHWIEGTENDQQRMLDEALRVFADEAS
ncbi:tRNA (adenosine(37)-N6)-dimethylallyltransferase MiaA [Adlercreutzia murintestinalis]|uniref:tRNA (adenosine(37)-N6)-dimethylallyltransferase MiaA n=1 Tax=Adlercreutzia murintestinalis TaxID=2941325 RepID=UPI00203E8F51|nr:tRNA (adenosine(37)-N6)-dimethylallyltransferase MiaA [Adlercreutzia murintestinalis]